jgi:hypothetical protein
MASPKHIYDTRRNLDPARQPGHALTFESLHAYVRDQLGLAHPYSLSATDIQSLASSCGSYCSVTSPTLADPPQCDYVYRFANLDGVLLDNVGRLPNPKSTRDASVVEESMGGSRWVPLSWLLSSDYGNIRRMLWWTTFPLHTLGVYRAASKIGKPSNHVSPDVTLILRMPYSTLRSASPRVPCIIDGFDSPVFLCTPVDPATPVGRTLDLWDPPEFALDADEFVTGPLPTGDIEFVARWTGNSHEQRPHLPLEDGGELWHHLEQVLKDLL